MMLKFVSNFIDLGLVLCEYTTLSVYGVSYRITNPVAVSSDWHPRIENDFFILRVVKSVLATRRPCLGGVILQMAPPGRLISMVCGNSVEFHLHFYGILIKNSNFSVFLLKNCCV